MNEIEKEIRSLKICVAVLGIVCVILAGVTYRLSANRKFDVIEVERINIVERDGALKMVISNRARQHPGVMDGVNYDEREGKRPPGLMFFSAKGDEIGGLIFDGNTGKGQGGSLTFDKFRGDQTIQLVHDEDADGSYFAGLKLNDQNIPLNDRIQKNGIISTHLGNSRVHSVEEKFELPMAERLRIGKERDKSVGISLKDTKGRARIELKVGPDGKPKLRFFDEDGEELLSLPK